MSEIAAALGHFTDAANYQKQLALARSAYHNKFHVNQTSGGCFYAGCTQTAHLMPLVAGAVPPALVPKVADILVSLIANGDHAGVGVQAMHLNLGIVGTTFVFDALTSLGADDVAMQVLLQDTYPSFGHMVSNNATTLWEAWEGTATNQVSSRNHIMFGGNLQSWVFSGIVGLDTESNGTSSGWQHILIGPVHAAVQKLGYAQGAVNTRFGNASVSWRLESGSLALETTVPPGATASLSIPLLEASPADVIISEDGVDVWKNDRFISGQPGISGAVVTKRGTKVAITFVLSSGSYAFKAVHASRTSFEPMALWAQLSYFYLRMFFILFLYSSILILKYSLA